MPSQDQIAAPSKVKATQVQLKPYHSRGKGLVPVWHSLHSKAGPFHASEGKSAVNMQVAELQKKIQLLGKMTPEGPEWSSQQPSDLTGILSLAFVQVSSIRRQKFMLAHGFPHLIQLFLSSEPTELYFILLHVCGLSFQWYLTLCDPMDCALPGSSARGILQARILKWVAIPFSRGSSQHRDPTHFSHISCMGRRVLLPPVPPRKPLLLCSFNFSKMHGRMKDIDSRGRFSGFKYTGSTYANNNCLIFRGQE